MITVLAVVLVVGGASSPVARGASPSQDLRARVLRALAGSTAAHVGVAVAADGLGPAVDVNGWLALPPASTQKLYTAGAALLVLGPHHRLRTEVRMSGEVGDDGTLAGDLVLRGGGDPTLVGDDLQRLAFAVAAAGVRHVAGSMRVDDSRYDAARVAPGWKPAYVPGESGALSALVVDHNQWRRDGDFLAAPSGPNGGRFLVALERAGISVAGGVAVGATLDVAETLVASHQSPPVATLVSTMLKRSSNLIAELLLKELGSTIGQPTTNGGIEIVWRLAEQFGLARGQAADGSGLSLHDRSAAWHQVAWLLAVGSTSVADHLRLSLPLACGDGTLQQRFCATPAAGRVFAKTGTLPGTVTLSGYTTTASGRRVWFSFLLSGATSTAHARAAIDRAVVAIVTFPG